MEDIEIYLLDAHCKSYRDFGNNFADSKVVFIQEHWVGSEGSSPSTVKDGGHDWAQSYCLPNSAEVKIFSIGCGTPIYFEGQTDEQTDDNYAKEMFRVFDKLLQYKKGNPDFDFKKIIVNTGHSYPIGARFLEAHPGATIIDCQPKQPGWRIKTRHQEIKEHLELEFQKRQKNKELFLSSIALKFQGKAKTIFQANSLTIGTETYHGLPTRIYKILVEFNRSIDSEASDLDFKKSFVTRLQADLEQNNLRGKALTCMGVRDSEVATFYSKMMTGDENERIAIIKDTVRPS